MIKVSVIIPTYNRAKLLTEAIDSVVNQTYKDFEIIIIDDGSTDNTKEALAGYRNRIKYVYQQNKGTAVARNRGIQESSGAYIAFLDNDDLWLPEKLSMQIGYMETHHDLGFSYSLAYVVDKTNRIICMKPDKIYSNSLKTLFNHCFIPVLTTVVRRECFDDIGVFDESLLHTSDYDFWLRCARRFKFGFIEKPLAKYRLHGDNASNDIKRIYEEHVKIFQKVLIDKKIAIPKKIKHARLANEFYLLSKIYFNNKLYFQSLRCLCCAIRHNPFMGRSFFLPADSFIKKLFKLVKPYCFLAAHFYLPWVNNYPLGRNKHENNILFYESSSGSGGSANVLAQLVKHLDRKKFYPLILTTAMGHKIGQIADAKIIRIRSYNQTDNFSGFMVVISSFAYIWETVKLYFIIKKYRITLTHINTNIIAGIPVIIASKLAGIPCICHIRQTRKLLRREKFFVKWVDKFIVLNQHMKGILKRYSPEEKIELIYDGVEIASPQNFGARNDAPCVGIVGRLVEGKGHEDFIKAASMIAKQKAETRFFIVGSDTSYDKCMESKLKVLTDKLNLNGNLTFTGWRDDISNIISSFNVAVYPYTAPEGLPNVIIETMAAGKPVISTIMPGPSEIIIDGVTGLLVPPNNPSAIADAVLRLLDNPDQAKKMGEQGRQRAEEVFDIKKAVCDIGNLYEEVLRSR